MQIVGMHWTRWGRMRWIVGTYFEGTYVVCECFDFSGQALRWNVFHPVLRWSFDLRQFFEYLLVSFCLSI